MGRAREWAVRCVHEASLWRENSFVTLTYRPDALPVTSAGVPTLRPRDFVLFMKRLRKAREVVDLPPGELHVGPRFLQAGEYGGLGRPHHHAVLFNCGFSDRVYHGQSPSGERLYRSAELERLWPYGFSSVGEVSQASAGYVARYTLKKVSAEGVSSLPGVTSPGGDRQDALGRVLEYMTMSRRPGIGAGWLAKFRSDVYGRDRVVVQGGAEMRPPRFYDSRMEREDPDWFAAVLAARKANSDVLNQDRRAMHARELLSERKTRDFLKRGL